MFTGVCLSTGGVPAPGGVPALGNACSEGGGCSGGCAFQVRLRDHLQMNWLFRKSQSHKKELTV